MFDWKPNHIVVDRISVDQGSGKTTSEEVLSCSGFPPGSETFMDLIDHQLRSFIKQKVDTGKSSACKAYSFTSDDGSASDDLKLMRDGLLAAQSLETFEASARKITEKVERVSAGCPGVLVQIHLDAQYEDESMALVFISLMSYLPTERVLFSEEIDLEEVPDVVQRSPTKALLYPMGSPDGPWMEHTKILSRPASGPFTVLLDVEPPPTTERLLQDLVAKATEELEPDLWASRKAIFGPIPPKKRFLFGPERIAEPDTLMDATACGAIARQATKAGRELYSKQQLISLQFDGCKVELPMDLMGTSFAFAREGGDEFLILRSKSITTSKGQVGPHDLLDPETIEEAVDRLKG